MTPPARRDTPRLGGCQRGMKSWPGHSGVAGICAKWTITTRQTKSGEERKKANADGIQVPRRLTRKLITSSLEDGMKRWERAKKKKLEETRVETEVLFERKDGKSQEAPGWDEMREWRERKRINDPVTRPQPVRAVWGYMGDGMSDW